MYRIYGASSVVVDSVYITSNDATLMHHSDIDLWTTVAHVVLLWALVNEYERRT